MGRGDLIKLTVLICSYTKTYFIFLDRVYGGKQGGRDINLEIAIIVGLANENGVNEKSAPYAISS